MASATAVTAVGAVVGITGTGATASSAQTVDTASTTTKLLDVPGTTQAQQVSSGVLTQADAQTAAYDEAQRFQAEEAARIQAEQQAAADKAAADKAAAEKAAADKAKADKAAADKAAADRASRSDTRAPVTANPGDPRAIAQSMMSATQYQCFSNIVERESGWNYKATNASSGAYGLVQALPGSKMATAGADWRTNPETQIKWGLDYMNSRYGSPCAAWSFWQSHHWY
ncbi:transglycosylase SLT domain-containing protein [Yinghuangia seranimata]|uniref:aggregation-promoting factor C-terminal-like domain-containing protein n=1 Tax=Yinghuangia seranimata TaxID=408067 RepID=UPI00248D277C|nr:transglycosylase SLT domain-containing protein [Yinghuangia seranimata]MDI2128844.1 transglycosylase SLT domain-containing protein [Yinghuangia seranimata]